MNRRLVSILLLATGLRCIHLDAPISGRDAWRQADTAAIARNFHREGMDLFHPAVDWRGTGAGWVQSEFPIYSWVHALLGGGTLTGRLLAIAGGLLAIYALYRLLRDMINERAALWGALIIACSPVGVYYTRTVQPDAWMFGAQISALWLTRSHLTDGPRSHGPLAALAFTIACLIKPHSIVLLLPLAALFVVHRGWDSLRSRWVLGTTVGSIALVAGWYLCSSYKARYFGTLSKPRSMSGITCDTLR